MMKGAKRVFVNVLAQHIRSVVNTCLSLYSTRLVLMALGQSDFGVFSLVGGVVAMLGFITNAMVVATQRHLSFYHGKGNMDDVRKIFSNSLFLHIVIGLGLAAVILLVEPLLFDGFLNIDPARTSTAKTVYAIMVCSLFLTFIAAPYKALFVARENIVYISIVEVCDGVLKLLCAIMLLRWQHDRLIAYAVIMSSIMGINYLAYLVYARRKFPESVVLPSKKEIDGKTMATIFNFAGWSIYSTGCIIGRLQGMAVVLNRFFGTLANTAYGIAMQVSGAVGFVASAVTNAISPQIYKAEGTGDRQRMLMLSEASSKFAYLLLATVAIPLVFEMNDILKVWLGEVPDEAPMLCRFVLVTALADQITTGLGTANYAIGRIRTYTFTVNTIKLLTIPCAYLALYYGYGIEIAMCFYLGFEILCALIRLPFLKAIAGLSITHFAKHVFLRCLPPTVVLIASSWLMVNFAHLPLRFLFTIIVAAVVTAPVILYIALERNEREILYRIFRIKT